MPFVVGAGSDGGFGGWEGWGFDSSRTWGRHFWRSFWVEGRASSSVETCKPGRLHG